MRAVAVAVAVLGAWHWVLALALALAKGPCGILADGNAGVPVLDNHWQRRADRFALAPQDSALVNQRPVIAIHPV